MGIPLFGQPTEHANNEPPQHMGLPTGYTNTLEIGAGLSSYVGSLDLKIILGYKDKAIFVGIGSGFTQYVQGGWGVSITGRTIPVFADLTIHVMEGKNQRNDWLRYPFDLLDK